MEFILDTEDLFLSPEKLMNTHYDINIGEFIVKFYNFSEMVKFAYEYNVKLQIEAQEEVYEMPRLVLIEKD